MFTTFLPLYVLLFQGIAFALLGILFLWSRFFKQPLERIRLFQFGLATILLVGVLLALPLSPKWTLAIATPEIQLENQPQVETSQPIRETPKSTDRQTYPSEVVADRNTDAAAFDIAYSEPPLPYPDLNEHEKTETAQSVEPVNQIFPQQTPEEAKSEFNVIPYLGMLFFVPPFYLLLSSGLARWKLAGIVARSVFQEHRETVIVRISTEIDSPLIFGLWRTILLIPQRMTHTNNDYEAAIAHEMAHYRRGDLWTWAYVRFCQYILWPQPLYWSLRRQLLIDQDFLADHDGAEQLADRADYAETLFKLATVQSRGRGRKVPQNVLGMAASNKSQLTRRIEMILGLAKQPLELKLNKRRLVIPLAILFTLMLFGGILRINAQSKPGEALPDEAQSKEAEDFQPSKESYLGFPRTKTYNEVHGRIVDEQGNPMEGVLVQVSSSGRSQGDKIFDLTGQETKTDSDGRFQLNGPFDCSINTYESNSDKNRALYQGKHFFYFSFAGKQREIESLFHYSDKTNPNEFNVVMKTAVPLQGRVVDDQTGKGVGDMKVWICSVDIPKYHAYHWVKTDAQGYYKTPYGVVKDKYVIYVYDENDSKNETLAKTTVHVTPDKAVFEVPELRLVPCGWIEGSFVDVKTGEPVKRSNGYIEWIELSQDKYPFVINRGVTSFPSGSSFKIRAFPGENYFRFDKGGDIEYDGGWEIKSVSLDGKKLEGLQTEKIDIKPGESVHFKIECEHWTDAQNRETETEGSYVEKFLAALKEKRYTDAAECLTGIPFIDEWNGEELQKLFDSCEKRNAIKRGVHPSRQEKIIVGPFEKYDVPVKKTYPGGGVLWESAIRFRNAAMSIAFAVDQSGKITGFEIAPLPNEPAPESCGWSGGYVIAKSRGYDCTIIVECLDAEGKPFEPKDYSHSTMSLDFYRRIPSRGNGNVWVEQIDPGAGPAGLVFWEKYRGVSQSGPDEWKNNEYTAQLFPPGTYRVLLSGYNTADAKRSGNVLSEPIVLNAETKERKIKLQLEPGGSIVANIVDAKTGEPLKNAYMRGLSFGHAPRDFVTGRFATNNARDHYVNLVPGKYEFKVVHPDYQASDPVYEPEREQYEATVEANKETVVEIKMNKREHTQAELDERWPYILTGTVRDTSGKPLTDATVTVRRQDIVHRNLWLSSSTTSDKEGKFTLRFNPYSLQTMLFIKPTPEKPDCMEFRLEAEKEGYVWKGTRNSNGEIEGGELDETGKAATYSTHFCIEPVPNDLTKVEHGWGENKRNIKPEEVVYRLKPYNVDIVMSDETIVEP